MSRRNADTRRVSRPTFAGEDDLVAGVAHRADQEVLGDALPVDAHRLAVPDGVRGSGRQVGLADGIGWNSAPARPAISRAIALSSYSGRSNVSVNARIGSLRTAPRGEDGAGIDPPLR